MTPLFSIAHATARPNAWRGSYDAWIARAANPEQVEYILCVDERWGFQKHEAWPDHPVVVIDSVGGESPIIVWNEGPKSCVSSWNTAAAASTGDIIILNADDMVPPHDWDAALLKATGGKDPLKDEFIIHISVGGEADKRDLIILQILSRARYERLGYALYPLYESMFSDNEFTSHGQLDGCYIDARHLRWVHRHPFNGVGKMDEVYKHQNRPQAYEEGLKLFEQRKKEGFPAWLGK